MGQPKLMSVIGTFLPQERHHVYRQVVNIHQFDQVVVTEGVENLDVFPFENLVILDPLDEPERPPKPQRPRGPKLPLHFRLLPKDLRRKFCKPFRDYEEAVVVWETEDMVKYKEEFAIYKPKAKAVYLDPYGSNLYNGRFDLVKAVRELKPDLLHVYFGNKAVLYLKQIEEEMKVPWVVSFHGGDLSIKGDDEEFRKGMQAVLKSATLVLARSEALLNDLVALGCSREKLRLNRTCIPTDAIPFSQREVPENGEWVIVQACRLMEKKGLKTSLEAFKQVRDAHPAAKFVICGSGPLEEELKARVQELGLVDAVEFHPHLDHDKLFQIYSSAHIFLHPSETPESGDQEGVPNALLEGMAAGLPFVSTHHGGIPEVLTDGEGGHLVPEKEPDEVAAALLKLMEGGEHYQACSRKAREVIESKFSIQECVGNLEKIYSEAIQLYQDHAASA